MNLHEKLHLFQATFTLFLPVQFDTQRGETLLLLLDLTGNLANCSGFLGNKRLRMRNGQINHEPAELLLRGLLQLHFILRLLYQHC